KADQPRAGLMIVSLRVAAARIRGDEAAGRGLAQKAVVVGLDPAVARGALVVERQLAVDDVREDVTANRRATAHFVGLELGPDLEEVAAEVEALGEIIGVLEHKPAALIDVHDR